MSLRGHFWTIWPVVRHRLKPWAAPPSTPWTATVDDPQVGPVPLTGRLTRDDPRRLLVLVHGLGGCHDSPYLNRACAVAASEHGLSTFRFEMRGSDRSGADLYHAGLSADLGVALGSPELREFEEIYLWGFSLGGHLALHYAAHTPDPRLRAVAAVSSPLDLEATVERFDEPSRAVYQRHVLRSLKELYRAVDARHGASRHDDRVGVESDPVAERDGRKLDDHILHGVAREVAALACGRKVADKQKVELESGAEEQTAVLANCRAHRSKEKRREEGALRCVEA